LGEYKEIVLNGDGVLYASKKSRWEVYTNNNETELDEFIYIGKDGNRILLKDSPQISYSGPFISGLARIKPRDSLWGYIDYHGEWYISPKYLYADNFKDNFAYVKTTNGKWGVINNKGEWAIPPNIEATEMNNLGFGIFSVRPIIETLEPYEYYDATTNKKIEWAKSIQEIAFLTNKYQEINGKLVSPILFGISENSQSRTYFDIMHKKIFTRQHVEFFFRDNKIFELGSEPNEIPATQNSIRLRFFDLLTKKQSAYFDLKGITWLEMNSDSNKYYRGQARDGSYYDRESRVSDYYCIFSDRGEVLSQHMFTDVYTISGDFAGVKIGGNINIYNLRDRVFVFDFDKFQLLPAGDNKWYVRDKNGAYLYSVENDNIICKMPIDDLLWTNGLFSIAINRMNMDKPHDIRSQRSNSDSTIAYINDDNVRLRTGPSMQDDIIGKYSKGTRILIVEMKNSVQNIDDILGIWMKVQILNFNDENREYKVVKEGWMFSPYIDILGEYLQ
jgi:hypothetical protein